MTPKEKAKELVEKFEDVEYKDSYQTESGFDYFDSNIPTTAAKQCALICVDEMIIQNGELYLNGIDKDYYTKKNNELFEIKQEIEKL